MNVITASPRVRKWLRRALIGVSLALNVAFGCVLGLHRFNSPSGRIGRLTRDVRCGTFGGSTVVFSLPAGLTVRDASPRGLSAIDLFEPNRFAVVITTEGEGVVDYETPEAELSPFGELYSLDLERDTGLP